MKRVAGEPRWVFDWHGILFKIVITIIPFSQKFLENPELYVPPLAPHPLPSADMIPKRLTLSELKKRFPKCAELQGYCPVTYQDGKQRQVLTLVEVQDGVSTWNK